MKYNALKRTQTSGPLFIAPQRGARFFTFHYPIIISPRWGENPISFKPLFYFLPALGEGK